MSCEKNTDRLFLNNWDKIFNHTYKTNNNKDLFDNYIPDGYDIIDNNLFIIENKKEYKNKINAKNQLIKYYNIVIEKDKYDFNEIYLIFGYGDNETNFNYEIYIINNEGNLIKINKTLENIKEKMSINNNFDEKEIHKFNQYLYDTIQDLVKSEKTLFVASILLTLDIDPDFLKDYDINKPGFIIAVKMLELIQNKYNDDIFTSKFNFLKKSLNNKYLYNLINKISINIKKYGKDILNKFYSEFCKYDKNDDSKIGVVLTPHDIIELMTKELNIKKDDIILDFCLGTGSFLLEASKYSKNLIGCECNNERYVLSKCNFILNDLDYSNLYYNSCFNQNFPKVDKSIINPPFSCNCPDENVEENTTNWKSYKEEQKFLLYQIQCLKENGLGACIIPRSNFNNSIKKINDFKKELLKHIQIIKIINCNNKVFYPINVECAIIIYKRIKSLNEPKISKNVKIIDYSNDGYEINKNIRYKIKEPKIIEQIRDLNYNDDWNFIKNIDIPDKLNQMIKLYNTEYTNTLNKNDIIKEDDININELNKTKYKLSDLFEIIKVKSFITNKTNEGNIPLYGATQLNNPVKYINEYSIDTYNNEDILIKRYGVFCINKTGDGGAGISFIRKGKFAVNSTILCCKMKLYITLTNAGFISYQLHNILNRSNSLNLTKFNELEVYLLDDDINFNVEFNIKQFINEDLEIKEWKKLKIGDYFDLLPRSKDLIGGKKSKNSGIYPLISTSSQNNGIIKYIDTYDYDGENNEYLTIATTGTSGSCFYQKYKFSVTTHKIFIITPKKNNKINLHLWALMINYYLPKKYSYSNGISIDKLLNEEIYIPFFENNN